MAGQIWPVGCSFVNQCLVQAINSNGDYTCYYKLNEMEEQERLFFGMWHMGSYFPNQGWNPCTLHGSRVLTTEPPGYQTPLPRSVRMIIQGFPLKLPWQWLWGSPRALTVAENKLLNGEGNKWNKKAANSRERVFQNGIGSHLTCQVDMLAVSFNTHYSVTTMCQALCQVLCNTLIK